MLLFPSGCSRFATNSTEHSCACIGCRLQENTDVIQQPPAAMLKPRGGRQKKEGHLSATQNPRRPRNPKHERSSPGAQRRLAMLERCGTRHVEHATKKGRLAAALRSSRAASSLPCHGSRGRLAPVITGLVGLAVGLMISSVAPARSVCCSVRSPMCSFSPSSTR